MGERVGGSGSLKTHLKMQKLISSWRGSGKHPCTRVGGGGRPVLVPMQPADCLAEAAGAGSPWDRLGHSCRQ